MPHQFSCGTAQEKKSILNFTYDVIKDLMNINEADEQEVIKDFMNINEADEQELGRTEYFKL